jgi:hypothetical protein
VNKSLVSTIEIEPLGVSTQRNSQNELAKEADKPLNRCYNNILHTQKDTKMFKIGDKVSWQVRNMLDSTRGSSSFYSYNGVIVSIDTDSITAEYSWSRNGTDVYLAVKKFRPLKNGKWIASTEKKDDPKGRLYLTLDME